MQEPDEHERRDVVRELVDVEGVSKGIMVSWTKGGGEGGGGSGTYLLTKAYPRPRIERQEYHRVRCQVLVQPFVEEPIGVELRRYGRERSEFERRQKIR